MCALLVDALAHGKSEIVMPKKLGKRIQNYHDYYSKQVLIHLNVN